MWPVIVIKVWHNLICVEKCNWIFVDRSEAVLHTHTHTHLTALFPGLPRWAGTRKEKPIWILLKHETMSGSGISWAICNSAPRSRQITTPAPHCSVFLQAGCPSCCPTKSVLTNTGNKYFCHLSCKMRQILYKKYQFMWPVIVTEVWHNLICVEKMPLNFNWWILSCSKVLEKWAVG